MAARLSDEKRNRIIAELLTGERPAVIAEAVGVSKKTVERIRLTIKDRLEATQSATKALLDEMLLEYVRENLITLNVLAREIRRPEFIRAQKGNTVSVLYGVMSDKAFRVLAAYNGAEPGNEAPSAET